MKDKLFFLLALPLTWFVVAMITDYSIADKVYLLAVAPSAWLILFEKPLSITTLQMQFAGLPVMFLIGFILFKLKMKPRTAIISSVIITFILWFTVAILASRGTAIKVPGALVIWIFCCFNFSLCLLPFLTLPNLLLRVLLFLRGLILLPHFSHSSHPSHFSHSIHDISHYQIKPQK